jgi:hypothetical protein
MCVIRDHHSPNLGGLAYAGLTAGTATFAAYMAPVQAGHEVLKWPPRKRFQYLHQIPSQQLAA